MTAVISTESSISSRYTDTHRDRKLEGLDPRTQELLEAAALLHDIGIKVSEEKYHSSAGKYQEIEGPAEARKLLDGICPDKELTDRVCWLIGHHHTYSDIQI